LGQLGFELLVNLEDLLGDQGKIRTRERNGHCANLLLSKHMNFEVNSIDSSSLILTDDESAILEFRRDVSFGFFDF
jgi:hypothetical protein